MTDVPIRPLSNRRVLSLFTKAAKLGEERARIPAWLVNEVYGRDVGRLLDQLEGTSWKLEGAVGEDVVFVRMLARPLA